MLRWAPALGYVMVTAAFLAPVAGRLGSDLVGSPGGDDLESLWNAWWLARSLLRLESPFWTDLLFAPAGTSLAWHSFAMIPSGTVAVLHSGLPLPLAYNAVLLAALPVAGAGGFALCHHLTRDRAASFAGGCVFMLCPFMASKTLGHIDLAYTGLLAFLYVALLRAVGGGGRSRWTLALTSGFVLLSASPNAGIFAANLTLFLFCSHVRRSSLGEASRLFAKTLAPTVLLVAPYLILLAWHTIAYGIVPGPQSDLDYNPEPVSYLLPFTPTSVYSAWPRSLGFAGLDGVEPAVYLGVLVLPMAIAGLVIARGEPLVAHLVVIALVFLSFSLGPKLLHEREVVEVAGVTVYLPFGLWRWVPVLGAVGQSGRYLVIVYLVMAVGVAHAVRWARTRWGSLAPAAAVALVCADFAFQPVMGKLPEVVTLSPAGPDRQRVLDPRLGSADTMYQQTRHGRALVGGYISRPPESVLESYRADPVLAWFFDRDDPAVPERAALVAKLRQLRVGDVLLAHDDPRADVLASWGFERRSENAYTVVWSRPD